MGVSSGVKESPLTRRRDAAAVALVAAACFVSTLGNGFTLDDLEIVVRNPLVTGPAAGDPVRIFTSHYWAHLREAGNLYRPLAVLSYATNHALAGPSAWSFHAVNVALHALASLLALALGWRLGLSRAASLAAGLIFAAHPVHTEAVAGVVGRADLMAACAVLGGWALHLGGGGTWRGALVGLTFMAGLFSKENAIVLPALMMMGDLRRDRGLRREAFRARLPAWAACAAGGLVWLALRHAALPDMSDPGLSDAPLVDASIPVRALTALHVLARYAGLLIAPIRLSADYSFNQIPLVTSPADPLALAGGAALVLLAAAFLRGLRRENRGRAGWVLAGGLLVSLLPVSNLLFPIGIVMAERLLYLPSAFFCLGIPVVWSAALTRVGERSRHEAGPARRAAAVLTAAAVLAGGARAIVRNRDWRDQLALFTATVRTSPRSASAHYNLGVALEDAGRAPEAMKEYEAALAIKPEDFRTHHNAGLLLAGAGRLEEAVPHLEIAWRIDPASPGAAASLGAVYDALGRHQDAERVLRDGLSRGPGGEDRHRIPYNLGTLLLRQGRAAEALPLLQTAHDALPSDPDGLFHLGLALLATGKPAEARDALEAAARFSPAHAEAYLHIARASIQLGDRVRALDAIRRARAAGVSLPGDLQRYAGEGAPGR